MSLDKLSGQVGRTVLGHPDGQPPPFRGCPASLSGPSRGTHPQPDGGLPEPSEQEVQGARDCVGLASESDAVTASLVEACDSSLDAVPATVPATGLHLQPCEELTPAGSHDIAVAAPLRDATGTAGDAHTVAGRSPFIGDVVAAVVAELEGRRTKRDAGGRYAKTNTGAVVDGTSSDQLSNALLPLQRAIVAQVTRDQGSAEKSLPATLGRLVEAFAEVTLLRAAVFQTMAGRPTTAKGHTRRLLSAYLQLVDREQRLASAIGLERSKAAETRTFAEVLEAENRE